MAQQPIDIFDLAVYKYKILLKSNMEEDLLTESALGIIFETPEGMHSSLFLKFTFMFNSSNSSNGDSSSS